MNMLTVGFAGVVCILMFLLVWIVNSFAKERLRSNRTSRPVVPLQAAIWEEKRQHRRVEIKWPVTIQTAQGSKEARTNDVSLGGAFISCSQPLPLGEIFPLTINVPDQEAQTVTAEIVWSNINVPEDKVINRGMGVRFIQISNEAREFLNEAISAHLDSTYASISSPETRLEEKRKHPRAKIKWPIRMETALGSVDAKTRDVSLGGAFISCSKPLPVGEVFPITINVPDQEPKRLTAEVVWCNANIQDDRIVNRGIGIRFIEISNEVRQFLNEAISANL